MDTYVKQSSLTDNSIKMTVDDQSLYEEKLYQSIAVLEETLHIYKHDELFLSFNGGKDCTVLLHLVCKLFAKRFPSQQLLCLYIQPNDPFDEIEEFVSQCKSLFNITVDVVQSDVKTALHSVCDRAKTLKACIMGCRRTDPYCSNLKTFQETDPGWPSIMRVNPLLDWTCGDIWRYIHQNKVPYCSLYKYGYTSIGDKSNTIQNPHLKYLNPLSGKEEFKHADQLVNMDSLERAGRIRIA